MTSSQKKIFESIISQYPTPSYVFDIGELTEWIGEIRNILSNDVTLCYAMKANPFLTSIMSDLTDRLEVCSPGEYEICIRNNIDPEMIVVSGVNKTPASMKRIMSYSRGAGIYTIESPLHYNILKDLCTGEDLIDNNRRIQLLLRLSSGNQFGMDENTLKGLIKTIQTDNIMDIRGIHYYGGTQKTSRKMQHELDTLKKLGESLHSEFGLDDLELEYGPGLIVTYFREKQEDSDRTQQLHELTELLADMRMYSHITIELGRYLAAYCGYFMTGIMDIKHTNDVHYLITDGGIHQLSYYGQMLGMKQPYIEHFSNNHGDYSPEYYTICGSLCTSNDILVKQYELSNVRIGDVLVFERCGAYSITEAMALFLSRELPQVLILESDNTIKVIREIMETNPLNS